MVRVRVNLHRLDVCKNGDIDAVKSLIQATERVAYIVYLSSNILCDCIGNQFLNNLSGVGMKFEEKQFCESLLSESLFSVICLS